MQNQHNTIAGAALVYLLFHRYAYKEKDEAVRSKIGNQCLADHTKVYPLRLSAAELFYAVVQLMHN